MTVKENSNSGGVQSVKIMTYKKRVFFFVFGATASPPHPVGQDLLIHEVSISHTTTHHSQ